ncbi:short-chain dehydrogenase [Planotetraspora thailandica]|uniref:Short-chain dehydrogenase n=1 Tax=Planotetraspora thailandica TaxID=487172 RepID=A0A8J3V9V7_9ACTN|nr:SDR family NAD(P)-dependent oxidoreductase [Planotetraspora thailandica]GII52740.1 short-chain dehydrogenase [Planotetraspora thailandica]
MQNVVIVGGTGGIGRQLALAHLARGNRVIVSGRDAARAQAVATELNATTGNDGEAYGIRTDLRHPTELARSLADLDAIGVDTVDTLVLAGMERDLNTVSAYDIARAVQLVTVKIVGYTTMVHLLRDRIAGSVLLFGGTAKDTPFFGSTTVSTVNAAVTGMVRTLSLELAPIRVNAIHLGIVADSPFWQGDRSMIDALAGDTLARDLTTTADAVHACLFLTDNPSANQIDLRLDGGRR